MLVSGWFPMPVSSVFSVQYRDQDQRFWKQHIPSLTAVWAAASVLPSGTRWKIRENVLMPSPLRGKQTELFWRAERASLQRQTQKYLNCWLRVISGFCRFQPKQINSGYNIYFNVQCAYIRLTEGLGPETIVSCCFLSSHTENIRNLLSHFTSIIRDPQRALKVQL